MKEIDNTGGQRLLGADDCKVDMIFRGECRESFDILGLDIDIISYSGRPGITGGYIYLFDLGTLRYFPGDGVFAGSAANNEDSNLIYLLWK
jgi:hypothetical protein